MRTERAPAALACACALAALSGAGCGQGTGATQGVDVGRAALELRSVDDPASACGEGRRIAVSQALAGDDVADMGDGTGSDTSADTGEDMDMDMGLGADARPTQLGSTSEAFDEDDKRFAFDVVLDLSRIGGAVSPGDVVRAAISVSPGSALEGAGAPAPSTLALTERAPLDGDEAKTEAEGDLEPDGEGAVGVPKLCQRAFVAYNTPGSFELSVRSFDAVAYLSVVVEPEEDDAAAPASKVEWDAVPGGTFEPGEEIEVRVTVKDGDGNALGDVAVSWEATLPGVFKEASTTGTDGVAENTLLVPENLPTDPGDPFALRPIVLTATAGAAAAQIVLSPE